MNHPFFSLPEATRRAAAEKACRDYGVESVFDLEPGDRVRVYTEAVEEFDREMRLAKA